MSDRISVKESKSIISLSTGVFLVFLFLKLAEIGQVTTWSWWWVTSPLWIPLGIVLIILLALGIMYLLVVVGIFISDCCKSKKDKSNSKKVQQVLDKLNKIDNK